jgi:hypothetical protein
MIPGWTRIIRILGSLAPWAAGAACWAVLFQYLPDSLYRNQELLHYVVPTLGAGFVGFLALAARLFLELRDTKTPVKVQEIRAEAIVIDRMVETTISQLSAELGKSPTTGWYGWPHFLGVSTDYSQEVSPLGTSYGIKILLLSREPQLGTIRELVSSLFKMQLETGGWAAVSQGSIARPEITAFILATIHSTGVPKKQTAPLVPRRNLDSGLTGGRLSRSGAVRISTYFRTL